MGTGTHDHDGFVGRGAFAEGRQGGPAGAQDDDLFGFGRVGGRRRRVGRRREVVVPVVVESGDGCPGGEARGGGGGGYAADGKVQYSHGNDSIINKRISILSCGEEGKEGGMKLFRREKLF